MQTDQTSPIEASTREARAPAPPRAAAGRSQRPDGSRTLIQKLIPVPHYMALASLDVWARLIFTRRAPVGMAYLPRLACNLFTSYFGTLAALPERLLLAPVLFFKFRSKRPVVEHPPGTLVVLGYFRSGTTHLQYLLSCDPRFRTPIWAQSILPHGWLVAWTFARFALTPFISNSRPQDDVALGPAWPAEDDFGVSNMSLCSAMPGRFLMPRQEDHYGRFHALEGLTERELARWRRSQASILWKITRLTDRMLLLKSPSHTARVAELRAMLGENVKFVHITRDAHDVVRSNVAMYERLAMFHLQDAPPLEESREQIIREYLRTEEKFLEESADLPPDRLCRIRYQDLIADPEGTVRAIYGQLNIPLTDEALEAMRGYLYRVRAYRTASQKAPRDAAPEPRDPRLEALSAKFDHARPPAPKVPFQDPRDIGTSARRQRAAWIVAPVVTLLLCGLWLLIAWTTKDRLDSLVWPVGAFIGWSAIRTAGIGSRALGIMCAALTALALFGICVPATNLAYGWTGRDLWQSLLQAFDDLTTWMYLAFGIVTAYRFASRTQVRPPGL